MSHSDARLVETAVRSLRLEVRLANLQPTNAVVQIEDCPGGRSQSIQLPSCRCRPNMYSRDKPRTRSRLFVRSLCIGSVCEGWMGLQVNSGVLLLFFPAQPYIDVRVYPGGTHPSGYDLEQVRVAMRIDVSKCQPSQAAVPGLGVSLK